MGKRRKILGDEPGTLGKRIKEARERSGYKTFAELRQAIEERGGTITGQYLGQLESGKIRPSFQTLKMILDACGVSISEFMGSDLTIREDTTILAARLKAVRERAGYTTPGQLWKAIKDRGGHITRQYLYDLENGIAAASVNKLATILDVCGVSMSDFLGTDLIIVPRRDTNIEERKLVTMLTAIRKLNPSLARVVEGTIISAHSEALKLTRQQGVNGKERRQARRANGEVTIRTKLEGR